MSKSPDRPFLPAALAGAVIALAVGTLLLAHAPQPPAPATVRPVAAQTTRLAETQASRPSEVPRESDEHDEDDD